ncbi:MAG: hypothetical protein V4515_14625, partial [Chloroflexota bacterium]
MPLFENNLSPYLTIVEATEPSAPSAGQQRLYIDSTTHLLKATNSSGTDRTIEGGLTNPMSAVGDIIQGTTAGAPAALAAPLAGKVLTGAGVTTPLVWSYPPGKEVDYVEITSGVNLTATTEATANTIISSSAIAYDGSTAVLIEFYAPDGFAPNSSGAQTSFVLYDGSGSIGLAGIIVYTGGNRLFVPGITIARRLTPSNATHTYSIRGYVDTGTGGIECGAGGSGARLPAFL